MPVPALAETLALPPTLMLGPGSRSIVGCCRNGRNLRKFSSKARKTEVTSYNTKVPHYVFYIVFCSAHSRLYQPFKLYAHTRVPTFPIVYSHTEHLHKKKKKRTAKFSCPNCFSYFSFCNLERKRQQTSGKITQSCLL